MCVCVWRGEGGGGGDDDDVIESQVEYPCSRWTKIDIVG